MHLLVISIIGKLLLHTAGVWGKPEQSLIGRGRPEDSLIGKGRHKKFPDLSSSYFQPRALHKVTLGSSAPVASATAMSREDHTQVTTDGVEAQLHTAGKMLIELRIPASLQQIQDGDVGPLSAFLDTVQSELCKAGQLKSSRLQLVGIRGEYTQVPVNQSDSLSLTKQNGTKNLKSSFWDHHELATMADQHVIVELEVSPGKEHSERTVDSIEAEWKTQLTSIGSPLLHGPLGMLLKDASMKQSPLSMSSRLALENAFKSSVVTFHSHPLALVLFPAFLWII
jgi:hypothetical protein